MGAKAWLSIGLGAGLAVAYGTASILMHKWALRARKSQQFMVRALGGILARLSAALTLMVLTLLLIPVHQPTFIGSFFGVFVLSLTLEVALLHRGADAASGEQ